MQYINIIVIRISHNCTKPLNVPPQISQYVIYSWFFNNIAIIFLCGMLREERPRQGRN